MGGRVAVSRAAIAARKGATFLRSNFTNYAIQQQAPAGSTQDSGVHSNTTYLMGESRVFIPGLSTPRSLYIAAFVLNMLEDGTCGQ
ncbi:predicted protein [Lichtheimia corymbifera JMRC:FSU:9682]|uniref:Uncharacterized protein n=1 Tax=Lichtheimia corymbifera JMRC:FSU:9682 TaxID=1263082 RepID=A0A068SGU7_9FUNG|nr:predicted protein [Lichtheimia corymbifera JMRC:FSU:9682]